MIERPDVRLLSRDNLRPSVITPTIAALDHTRIDLVPFFEQLKALDKRRLAE